MCYVLYIAAYQATNISIISECASGCAAKTLRGRSTQTTPWLLDSLHYSNHYIQIRLADSTCNPHHPSQTTKTLQLTSILNKYSLNVTLPFTIWADQSSTIDINVVSSFASFCLQNIDCQIMQYWKRFPFLETSSMIWFTMYLWWVLY